MYITWHDGRNRAQRDPLALCLGGNRYCFGDVFITRSTNAGARWSRPVRINPDRRAAVDQFFPAVEVDAKGAVWTLYYDRRNDPRNFLIQATLARSTDAGRTWTERIFGPRFGPITDWQDFVVNPFYMGDYVSVATDQTGRRGGVIADWGDTSLGDQNVRFERRSP